MNRTNQQEDATSQLGKRGLIEDEGSTGGYSWHYYYCGIFFQSKLRDDHSRLKLSTRRVSLYKLWMMADLRWIYRSTCDNVDINLAVRIRITVEPILPVLLVHNSVSVGLIYWSWNFRILTSGICHLTPVLHSSTSVFRNYTHLGHGSWVQTRLILFFSRSQFKGKTEDLASMYAQTSLRTLFLYGRRTLCVEGCLASPCNSLDFS
jgi:hypothetical protein